MKIGIITGKSGNTIVKHLNNLGHTVYVVTGDIENGGATFAKEYYHHFFHIGDDNNIVYKNICKWFSEKSIDGLILGTGVWFAHDIAKLLNESYGISCSHNIEYLSFFKNKLFTKKLFDEYGLKTPDYQFLLTKTDEVIISFPFVVKSNIDLFPVWLCHNSLDFNMFKHTIEDSVWAKGVLIEQYIEGNDLTIPVFKSIGLNEDSCLVYWSKQKNYKLEGFGELTNDIIPKSIEKDLLNECNSLISNTGYFGVCRFDIRVSKKDYYFLEINSVVSIRDSGTSYKAMQEVGINYVEKSVDVYINNIKVQNN
jgi:carbamoylphosphate synthase large subunit